MPPKYTRPVPEPVEYPGPESSGLFLHPRLRGEHRLGKTGLTIRHSIGSTMTNPRRMSFIVRGRDRSLYRTLHAVQDYGSTFVEITEQDQFYQPLFFDAENEPDIARYILKAFDVQWPMGALGVTRKSAS